MLVYLDPLADASGFRNRSLAVGYLPLKFYQMWYTVQ
jgi:hypothetical protein